MNIRITKYNILILLIICMALFMHIYQIDKIPYGQHVDEAAMAYDAWCIANFGVDRHLTSFPVYFNNFGTGQSVLYGYLVALFIKIGGGSLSTFIIRLPGIIGAFCTMFYGFRIVNLKWHSKKLNLLFLFLFSIMPYFTMQARFGLDCNLMLGTSTIFLFYLMKAFEGEKVSDYILSGIAGGVMLYAYILSHIILPVFLFLTFIYFVRVGKLKFRNIILMCIPLFILAFPLILFQIINYFGLPEVRLGFITVTKMEHYRVSEISFTNIAEKFSSAVTSVLFFDSIPYNTLPQYYTMYAISIPFLLLGLGNGIYRCIDSFYEKRQDTSMLILFWVVSEILIGSLTISNANKLNGIFFGLLFFILEGFYIIWGLKKVWKNHVVLFSLIVYCISFVSFFKYYFTEYSEEYEKLPYFSAYYSEALEAVPLNIIDTANVYINLSYVYAAGQEQISPYKLNIEEGRYGNLIFNLPNNLDDHLGAYIVHYTNTNYLDSLNGAGFIGTRYGDYYLYYAVQEN